MTVAREAQPDAPARGWPANDRTETGHAFPRWALIVGAAVVLAGVLLRFVTTSDMWLDEALTVNIARLPFSDLHEALRHDGAPPLFYVLLHGWISVWGSSDFAVRALSGVISVATLPCVWLAGRRLGRPGAPGPIAADPPRARLVAALAVVVVATSPFAIRYGTEARMYSLVMLLVTVGYLALRRALERPSLERLAVVAVLVGALLYTQYWTMYLVAVVGLAMLWRVWHAPARDARHAARAVVMAMIAGLITFLPWVPTFLYQSRHTGTPWGSGEIPFSSFRTTIDQFANGTSLFHTQGNLLALVLVVLVLLAVFGRTIGSRNIDLDLRTQPAVRWEAAAGFGALAVGLTVAWVTNSAFDARYASMMFPLFALVAAYGFTVFGSRAVMAGALTVLVVTGFVGAARNVTDKRTQAGQVAAVITAEAKPEDAVVYCPDQVGPGVSRLLGGRHDLVQLTFPAGASPELVNWVDYKRRIDATDPARFASEALDRTGTGHTLWYVYNSGYHGVEGKCEGVAAALQDSGRAQRVRVVADDKTFFEPDYLIEFSSR